MQRVFVKVVGFSDAERHALNTLFRLSEERDTGYALWIADYGVAAQIVLIDSESHEALIEFESPSNEGIKTIWVGEPNPAAWRSFTRPIDWPQIISLMDQVFMPPPDIEVSLDFDLEEAQDTQPPENPAAAGKRALIANADRAERLYIRARMSLADLTLADEAETAPDALELARNNQYDVAVVDFGLPGGKSGSDLIRELVRGDRRIPWLIVTKERLSAAEKARALLGSQPILLEKPVHPLKLTALLRRV